MDVSFEAVRVLLLETPSFKADSIAARVACACKASNVGAIGDTVFEVLARASDTDIKQTRLPLFSCDDAVIKKSPITFAQAVHLLDHVGKLLDIERRNGGHFPNLFRIVVMMSLGVMLVVESEFRIGRTVWP